MKGRIEKVNLSAVKAEDFFPISAYTFMNRVGREEKWGEKRKKRGTMEREEKAGEPQESRKQGAECFSQVCHRCLPQAQLYTLRSGWNITQFTGHSISQAKLLALPTLPSLCFPSP